MFHDTSVAHSRQDDRPLARHMHVRLVQFLRPVLVRLAQSLDIRLVQTALDLVQVIPTHRHRAMGLLLSELGGYLLGPDQAPAGAKRISNLVHADHWSADTINAVLWQQASQRVQALQDAGDTVLVAWDGSVWEKPGSLTNADWCAVHSAKGRRLARRRKGFPALPPSEPPILVPGLHWDGIAVLGHDGAPTLAHMVWWTTRGEHPATQSRVNQTLLTRCTAAWGASVSSPLGSRLWGQLMGAGGHRGARQLRGALEKGQQAAGQLGRGAQSLGDLRVASAH